MHEKNGIKPIKGTAIQHDDFAATIFLCGSPENLNRAIQPELGRGLLNCYSRKHGTRRDKIVPACVTKPRKRIVLGEDGNPWRALTPCRTESRWQSIASISHGKAVTLHNLSAEAGCMRFVESNLWMGVNIQAHAPHLMKESVHFIIDGLSNLIHLVHAATLPIRKEAPQAPLFQPNMMPASSYTIPK